MCVCFPFLHTPQEDQTHCTRSKRKFARVLSAKSVFARSGESRDDGVLLRRGTLKRIGVSLMRARFMCSFFVSSEGFLKLKYPHVSFSIRAFRFENTRRRKKMRQWKQSAREVARVDSERRELRSSSQTTSELSRFFLYTRGRRRYNVDSLELVRALK